MSPIKKIELKNFRVFKNQVSIDFHPITILTGANNSGKSSILKSMILLADNANRNQFQELDFSGEKHNLDSFKYSKTKNSDSDYISLNFQLAHFNGNLSEFSIKEMQGDRYFNSLELSDKERINVKLKYKQQNEIGKLVEFSLSIENIQIFSVKYDLQQGHSVYLNIKWLLKTEYHEFENNELLFVNDQKVSDVLKGLEKNKIDETIQLLDTEISDFLSYSQFNEKNWYKFNKGEGIFIDKSLHGVNKNSSFNISDFNDWWNENYDNLLDKLKTEKSFGTTSFLEKLNFKEADYKDIIRCFLAANKFNKFSRDKTQVSELLKGKVDNEIITKFENTNIASISRHVTEYNYFIYFENFIRYIYKDIANAIDILFIESFRANTKRIYSNQSQGTDFNQLLLDIHKTKFDDEIEDFINKWLIEFGIGKAIELKRIKGVATEVKILRNGSYIDLADLGFGTTQLVPIILNIALKIQQSDFYINAEKNIKKFIRKNIYSQLSNGKIRIHNFGNDYDSVLSDDPKFQNKTFLKNELYNYHTILIEEPETNLHPNFQSKLADLFVDASQKFNIQFIIETHSEYLIRKFQFLTARKIIKSADTKIYYFYEPDKIPDNEQQIKNIDILETGELSDNFGDGFLDEADKLAIDLFNMTKPKQSQN